MESPAPHPPVSANEILKQSNPSLAGTIATALADPNTEHFSDDDTQFLKFHGVYQHDDRDLRKTGRKYFMMVRVKVPGGVVAPGQYLELDRLADTYGNHTLRLTSRQTLQFHGVLKSSLAATIKSLNEALISTLATCGDVVRNITVPSSPATGPVGAEVLAQARQLAKNLAPVTPSYHAIWIDGKQLDLGGGFSDPLYGQAYLPRKFKISFAIPPVNDTDVHTNDLGLIAIVENATIAGYNLTAGGGLGRTHNNAATFPRLADLVGFVTPAQVGAVVRAAVTIHRDFSDRGNRKHARLKYQIAERGVAWFRAELEKRAGEKLGEARPFQFVSQADPFGWQPQGDGRKFLGLLIPAGRIKDTETQKLKTALRLIVERFQPEVRFTTGNNLILANIAAGDEAAITALLGGHGVPLPGQLSRIRQASTACVALPTCGLALAESERAFPTVIAEAEAALKQAGLGDEELILRISGCANGCSRPYVAELALVGKAPGKYQLYVGGNATGTRLARVYKDAVLQTELQAEFAALFTRFAAERTPAERFGDWAHRVLLA